MPVYHISTRISSNVSPNDILYDLCIYRMDSSRNKYIIVDAKQQPLQSNYETQPHATKNIDDPLSTIYIMEVMLYRKTMLHTHCVSSMPFTKMYTLQELSSGKASSQVKRENPCYFETKGTTKPESEGGNTVILNISIPERPFIAKEYPIGNVRDPFEKNTIARQIKDRFEQVDFPNQIAASVCGPAAFFYCLQKDRPDVYAQAARDLWHYGKTKIGELNIAPSEGCRHPSGAFYTDQGYMKISGLDWITLAGLRDSENAVLSFDALDSPVAGITMWGTLSQWFEKAGYEKVFSNVGVTQAGVRGIRDLNEYVKKGYKVVTLINDGLLEGSNSNLTVPTHWVVWEGPVTEDANGHVHLELFSWGKVSDWIKKGENTSFFVYRFFGGMVFKPLK
ncbi:MULTISPECIES: hypothetical protein [Yersinia pseudotuberculosis complex]|uniref:Uncharacterized protein n=1 Tax=Yersinia pseudotuberculosis serotype O:1b (strain IP 31758) TaxID=349747 RepID=A0A0U1QTK6_YERP3|nr:MULTISPECIES: hypothetical protein [Yersinia pseudotuberculosis complex]ABS45715.1 conserved hypothetical protein [Yersinia pseudotuberculosis IP 31758]MCE4113204.1 hypothetical protein [Yersinia pseudotuberculosis]RYC26220.1 hypothetical protein EU971_11090 [Yersinia pseudotuberculosis]UFA64041.1 Uncharacterized protein YP598_4433 [Yersinia pseudotuberculosis]WLF06028.1 hypothetical protein Q6G25_21445 [Yersinia pseudotuberculosis]